MDTGSDFIQPEFFNILFFQQRNLVVFPYVDLKHLHGLEIFTAGHNVVDLESTALHNLKEILEFERSNSYSQNPTLYFITNVDRAKVKELMELESIRCVINSNENIGNLANGSNFVFYNKKNNQFLNYDLLPNELEFETSLISNSQDEDILQENIQKIKIVTTRIFKELNQTGTLEHLPDLLSDYDKKYWRLILEFTSRYYDINIPDISTIKFKPTTKAKDFSDEYEVLISTNRALGKEFIQLLHEYRSRRVNPAHLELDELYNPQKLYGYLRNHHWKEGIPHDFVEEWYQMNISAYQLTESDQIDFESIVRKLDLKFPFHSSTNYTSESTEAKEKSQKFPIPSPITDWIRFKKWIFDRTNDIEQLTRNGVHDSILNELSDLLVLLKNNTTPVPKRSHPFPEPVSHAIELTMQKFKIPALVQLYGIQNRFTFVIRFKAQLDILYEDIFGKDKLDTPIRIKKFEFPESLQKKLSAFNRFRNNITHEEIPLDQLEILLQKNRNLINDTYLYYLSYLLRDRTRYIAQKFGITDINPINKYVISNYIRPDIFSQQEVNKIQRFLN
jgi:hypothetical protein